MRKFNLIFYTCVSSLCLINIIFSLLEYGGSQAMPDTSFCRNYGFKL